MTLNRENESPSPSSSPPPSSSSPKLSLEFSFEEISVELSEEQFQEIKKMTGKFRRYQRQLKVCEQPFSFFCSVYCFIFAIKQPTNAFHTHSFSLTHTHHIAQYRHLAHPLSFPSSSSLSAREWWSFAVSCVLVCNFLFLFCMLMCELVYERKRSEREKERKNNTTHINLPSFSLSFPFLSFPSFFYTKRARREKREKNGK